METNILEFRPAGYAYLLERFELTGMPHWHTSFVSSSGTHKSKVQDGATHDVYPTRYWPGDKVGDHLEFALKYDGVNLALLTQIFEHIPQEELTEYVKAKPTGKYARRIWFFYEFLTGRKLPLDDVSSGNYVDALEPRDYYTVQKGDNSQRHRIVNNLLGPQSFCPVIRRTEKLFKLDSSDLRKRCEEIVTAYPPELLRRALSYLYNKETKSSFEIEHIKPNASRTEKFITSLELAEKEDFCEKERLIELQNRIVDPRFKDSDYRKSQNYVGQTVAYQKEIIHFIGPKPDDLPDLMAGLIESHKLMKEGNVSPVIHAAAIAYGFVFLHPFERKGLLQPPSEASCDLQQEFIQGEGLSYGPENRLPQAYPGRRPCPKTRLMNSPGLEEGRGRQHEVGKRRSLVPVTRQGHVKGHPVRILQGLNGFAHIRIRHRRVGAMAEQAFDSPVPCLQIPEEGPPLHGTRPCRGW